MLGKRVDLLGQVPDASEGASPNRALRDDVEPDFDLIEPRRIGRRVVDMKTRSRCKPSPNALVFVGCIVVYDEMDIQFLWDGRFDVAQELEKLLVTMTLLALRQTLKLSGKAESADSWMRLT